ncbi:helix-turn-helix transcriptional regulator [Actinacidiphila paucisporea]|uniref:Regulatory protein, luxR family n=1 Tax=Actinacidiphila paucisporea TaxID=310782 RepID=A0A1M6YLU5_9ACTN|nr:helix-turn-helix transcriptional regulator [Actinacidiphila paucisporea]SHL19291.1 regulatory protein, luxR family [Actinacidiphila paucisporea]
MQPDARAGKVPGAGWFCRVPGAVFEAEPGAAARLVVEQYPLPQEHEQVLRELTDGVRESADALRQGGEWTGAAGLEAALALDAGMARRGVRVRAVYPRALLFVPLHAAHLRRVSDAGVSVRVLDHVPHDLLVFDRQTACLTAGPATGGAPLVRVKGTLLAASFAAIYESYWQRATPLSRTSAGPHHTQLGPREKAVIRLMTNGYSDDRIARKLGITAPDVQSVVTALMERLGAGSRFEAGYKLAREVDPRDL